MRIVFAGTPKFAVPALEALISARHDIIGVYTQPDRAAGRGRKLLASPVKLSAINQQLNVFQPASLAPVTRSDAFAALAPDIMVVVAYGLMIPDTMLQLPKYGCVNIHASLLPRWRGAAPIARAIEAGDPKTGISIMQMDTGLDTGDVILSKEIVVSDTDTAAGVHDRLAQVGASAILEALHALAAGTVTATPQNEALASYAKKLNKAEAKIDWQLPAQILHRKIRAYNPWPVAISTYRRKPVRLWQVGPLPATVVGSEPQNQTAGTIVAIDKQGIHVATGKGILTLCQLQSEGGRVLTASEFANGQRLKVGEHFDS